ncbi:hypothetical protein KW798_00840 [Candidatus Parcubacteria bacterium]|nr:hypothetical protein [Candidatus Parcubacteria bacterium]
MKEPTFAFFGTSIDSQFALEQLRVVGLEPAVIVDSKEIPIELFNTDWDFFLVCSYGKILKKDILDLPRRGVLNIHPSLLPKYRGPSPYVSNILADDPEVGVSVMLLEEKMDAGPILAQARIEIDAEDWPPKGLMLSKMLFTEGVNLLAEALPSWLDGVLEPVAQNESEATYTRKFKDEDAVLDLNNPREAFLKIQAFDKSPRAHFINGKGKRVIVTDAKWQDGTLLLERVLPEGKKEMPYQDYLRGQQN